MTESLTRWMGTADAIRHVEHFRIAQVPLGMGYIRDRVDDYYTALVGDLFDRMRENQAESAAWARLGNAFAQFAEDTAGLLTRTVISRAEAALYAAAAFYSGGFPASAYLSILRVQPIPAEGAVRACYDLLARPAEPVSETVRNLLAAVRQGNEALVAEMTVQALERVAVDYLRREFGDAWIGTKALAAAVVLHHGDIPQETREVLEDLLRRGHVMFAICTNTLAEGVNLPIRTLVLYSVQRRSGAAIAPLLSRDIKNLVGRAGRAGPTTKGLVICANDAQWTDVGRVALDQPGENLVSALRQLLDRLQKSWLFGIPLSPMKI
jgi:hypothetical protein